MDAVDIVSIIAAIVSIVALFFVGLQLRLQRTQIRLESLTALHEQLITDTANQALRKIYASSDADIINPSSSELLDSIEYVLGLYDLVGHRARLKLIPADDLLQTDWAVILRIDRKLSPFVAYERERREKPAPYKEGYSWLVASAESYRDRVAPGWQPVVFSRNLATGS